MPPHYSNALMGYQRFRDLPEHLKQEPAVIELCLSLYSAETRLKMLQNTIEVSREPRDDKKDHSQTEQ